MRGARCLGVGVLCSLLLVQPALAQSGGLSEPSDLSLLVLGVIGVVLGQRGSRKRPR